MQNKILQHMCPLERALTMVAIWLAERETQKAEAFASEWAEGFTWEPRSHTRELSPCK